MSEKAILKIVFQTVFEMLFRARIAHPFAHIARLTEGFAHLFTEPDVMPN